jgi:hypothetical protein
MTATGRTATARQAWDQLNERQQAYLLAMYDADQATEADIASRRRRMQETPPASQWRWLLYAVKGGLADDTRIQATVRRQGKLDPGAGSSLAALRRRELVLVRDNLRNTILGVVEVVEARLTTAGRAAARAGRDEAPKRRTPSGLLSEWLWGALVTLYRAGDTGTLYDHHGWDLPRGHPERGPSWNALLQLRDRRDGSYMEEFSHSVTRPGYTMASTEYRARISERGRAHAELHYLCYAELYPDVPPIEPAAPIDGAHTGLADHRIRRPHGLVRAPDWRLLITLTRLERDHRCPWREHVTREYTQWNDPVPAEVHAIPDGLNTHAAQRTAGSAAALDRLRAHPDGPLIEIADLPNLSRYGQPGTTIPLVCLTDAGRAHVATHAADYERLYPEIPQ